MNGTNELLKCNLAAAALGVGGRRDLAGNVKADVGLNNDESPWLIDPRDCI